MLRRGGRHTPNWVAGLAGIRTEPSAYAWNDLMVDGLVKSSTFKDLQNALGSELESDLLIPRFLSMVEKYFGEFKDHILPSLAPTSIHLYMPEDSTVYFDFKCLFDFLKKTYGYTVTLNDPRTYVDDPAGIHIRDSIEDLFFDDPIRRAHDLITHIRQQDSFILNPTSSVVGDQKSLLPYLKDRLPIINCHHLNKFTEKTLLSEFKKSKEDLVLKPSQGYGGYGIMIGRNSTQSDWDCAINRISSEDLNYIVQRYHQPDTHVDFWNHTLKANFNFWIFGGEFAGAFARTSSSEPINYHQGGALLPVVYF